jgi:AraC-like DNA-binding protein
MVNIISYFGLLVALILLIFLRPGNRYNIYLSGFFFILSLIAITRNAVFFVKDVPLLQIIIPLTYPFFYLAGPFLYFYIKNLYQDSGYQKMKWIELIHFLPVLMCFINISPQFFITKEESQQFFEKATIDPQFLLSMKTWGYSLHYNLVIRPIYYFGYSMATILFLIKNRKDPLFYQIENISKSYIFILVSLFLVHTLLTLMLVFEFMVSKNDGLHHLYLVMNYLNICVIVLLVSIYFFPKMLYGFISYDDLRVLNTLISMENVNFKGSVQVENAFKIIGKKLDVYFESKPYLQSGFNMSNVSSDTLIPYNQVSLFYRIYHQVCFSEWKNKVRIAYAVELIHLGEAEKCTLEAIASTCGYRTRGNFIKAFKEQKGVNPSVYLKSVKLKSIHLEIQ